LPEENVVTDKISGYATTEPVVPVKSSNSGGSVTDRLASDATTAAAAHSKSTDQVTLTSSARSLHKIEETIAKTPVVNADKVTAVKQQLNTGAYQIDAGRVADKLLQFERGLK